MREPGYLRLWRQPYIWKERGGIRWPGVLSVHWNNWRRAHFSAHVQNLCDDDGESRWPWLLHVHLLVVGVWLHLPGRRLPPIVVMMGERQIRRYGEQRQWGVSAYFADHGALHLHWNALTKVVWWPWDWTHMLTEVQREDGSWAPYVGTWERDKEPDGRKLYTFDYTYVQRDGEVQRRTATVYVERMFHRRRWLTWTRLGERCRQSIDFSFDGEVGSETGSWKGGVLGSGETMLPGETAEQTFRRMEATRRFDR